MADVTLIEDLDFGNRFAPEILRSDLFTGRYVIAGNLPPGDSDAFELVILGEGMITATLGLRFLEAEVRIYDSTGNLLGSASEGQAVALTASFLDRFIIEVSGFVADIFTPFDLTIRAPSGRTLRGTADAEVIFADLVEGDRISSGNDTIYGGAGKDTLVGGSGNDLIYGGDGNDQIGFLTARLDTTEQGENTVYGGGGADNIFGAAESQVLNGDSGNDTIVGYSRGDTLYGGSGHDFLNGWNGDDLLDGGTGSDTVRFGAEIPGTAAGSGPGFRIDLRQSVIETFEGRDTLVGIENVMASVLHDTLVGTDAANVLEGLEGDDELRGISGNDTLLGGAGNDALYGGDGNDVLQPGTDNGLVNGGAGHDRLDLSDHAMSVFIELRNDVQRIGAGDVRVTSVEGVIGTAFADTLIGGNNANSIVSGEGSDWIYGGAGHDSIDAGTGDDVIIGGAGTDRLFFETRQAIVIDLALVGPQVTRLGTKIVQGVEEVVTRDGADLIRGDQGANRLFANDGRDTLYGGDGNDTLDAGNGSDVLFGGDGNDGLLGGWGRDTLYGGRGSDAYFGGQDMDRDTFAFRSVSQSNAVWGVDVIWDFDQSRDRIDLTEIDANAGSAGNQAFAFTGVTAAAFSLWFRPVQGGVRLYADTTGDASADFELGLVGVTIPDLGVVFRDSLLL